MKRISTQELTRIRSLPDEELYAEIMIRAADVADGVLWLASGIEELARRQSDLADRAADICKSGFWLYLPLVASGQVSAMAVATFSTREKLLAIIAQLPLTEQERYSTQQDRIEVEFFNPHYGKAGQAEFDSRKYLPSLLPDGLFSQVFDLEARAVRDKQAQRAYLQSNRPKDKATQRVRIPTLRIDSRNMLIFVDNRPVTVSAIADAVATLAIDHPEIEKTFRKAFRLKATTTK